MTSRTSRLSPKAVRHLLAAGAFAFAFPAGAQAAVSPMLGGFESGGFSEFTQTGVTTGSLNVVSDRAYEGSRSAKATYSGGGANGYSRTIQFVNWTSSEDVWYGAAFYLPTGYKNSLQGASDIMRWDNYGTYASGADYGGVMIHSDDRARVMLGKYTSDPFQTVVPAFDLPEGRWFYLEVHQKFSTTPGNALTEVFIDGQKIAGSTAQNTFGRGADRIRTGIVSITEGKQINPVNLWFDRVSVSTSQRGPIGGATTPPPTTTTTTPTTTTTTPTTTTTTSTTGSTTTTPPPTTTTTTDVGGRVASFEDGTLKEFDVTNLSGNGRATVGTSRAYNGTRSVKFSKLSGATGFARGIFTGSLASNADFWYGGAYYVPSTFKSSLQGGVDILRWDNYGTYQDAGDFGGVRVSSYDKKGRLVVGKLSGAATQLGAEFTVPSDRWFWLEVHQKLSATSGSAVSEVYIDGQKVSSSTSANSYGRGIDRLRSGIVTTTSAQTNALELWNDRVSLTSKARGPVTTSATAARKRAKRLAAKKRAARKRLAAKRRAAQR